MVRGGIVKKKALRKDFYMEIKKSINRFISIILIVAMGTAFFAGIRSTDPDMKTSADTQYDQSNLMDIRVLSTLGLTNEDVKAIANLEGVKEVMPSYSKDFFCKTNDNQFVVKVMSVQEPINLLTLDSGRMPEKDTECVVDSVFLQRSEYKLGDTITLKVNEDEDIFDSLKYDEFTIVGSGTTSYYLSDDKGTSDIGSGEIDSFIMIPKTSFDMPVYTEIYLTVENAIDLTSYTEEYDDCVETVVENIEDISEQRADIRYEEVLSDANEELSEAETKLGDEKAKAEKELEDARIKLADAKIELEDGKVEIEDGLKKIEDGKKEIEEKKQDLLEGKEKLKDSEKEIAEGKVKIKDAERELNSGKEKLNSGEAQLKAGKEKLIKNENELKLARDQYNSGLLSYTKEKEQFEVLKQAYEYQMSQTQIDETQVNTEDPQLNAEMITQYEQSLSQAWEQLESTDKMLSAGEVQLLKGKEELKENEEKLIVAKLEITEGEKKLNASKADIKKYEQQIKDGWKEIEEGEQKILEAEEEIAENEVKLNDAYKDIEEGEQTLLEKNKEYEDGKKEAEEKILDAELKLADAKEEINKIKKPKWYVLDRNTLQTYVEFGQDSDRIGAIGKVFPVVFFLVAALVSLTTMTRMVEEERTQIGTLKALGYSKWDIASKYILYALIATLIGSILGVLIGSKMFPLIIINAYKMLYENLSVAVAPLQLEHSIVSTGIAVLCTTVATVFACYQELMASAAKLMRPAAPKLGKRVFLERMPFIWNHLNFTKKATIRNLIRYKKRFFMTVFGIGGCMALLLVGYGLKDSISSITEIQFNKIFLYDWLIGVNEDADESDKDKLFEYLNNDQHVTGKLKTKEIAIDVGFEKVEKSANLLVLESLDNINSFIVFNDRKTNEKYILSEDGVIITEKLAKLLNVSAGDEMFIKDGEINKLTVKILAVTENYFMHYVYMTPSLYQKLYHETVEYNQVLLITDENGEAFKDQYSEELLNYKAVSSIFHTQTSKSKFGDILGNLDIVMFVLIVSAGGLAFIVLYNLNNININERRRELATIKVLGFYNLEVSEYVFRENILLTLIGSLAGIVMGIFLHRYVILTAEVDMMMFGRNISLASFIISTLLTCLFSVLINISMHFKLIKINMVESLKSIE